jgi:hypothetical protein
MLPFKIVYAEGYDLRLGQHVFPSEKFRLIREALEERGIAAKGDFVKPEPALDADLLLVHSAEYVGKLKRNELSYAERMHLEIPWTEETRQAFWLSTGGTILAAQLALLSKLDSTDAPKGTVFVFTCNSTDGLEPRFLSRCLPIDFSSYGMAGELAEHLEKVWHAEGGNGNGPDFTRLSKECRNNVRDCLGRLEVELMAL